MKIVKAILFTNGIVMAFDENGQQVGDYQGEKDIAIPKIKKDFPKCPIVEMDWNRDVRPGLGRP